MVAWMTSAENKLLDTARRRGYLSCRRDQRVLIDQWTSLQQQAQRPVLRVERHAQNQCQVTLQWQPGLSLAQQSELRQLLQADDNVPGLLPIVFRYGAYSAFVEPAAAEALARRLASWLELQF